MVFLNTKRFVNDLYDYLKKEGFTVFKVMGGRDMDYAERDLIMKQFRKGEIKFLICTNLLSRGIDIPGMNVMVNFDVPFIKDKDGFPIPDRETYLHRVGRTGRFDTKGLAITLINELEMDNEISVMNNFEEFFQNKLYEITDIS